MTKSNKYKIGVYGSAAGDYEAFLPVAKRVGLILGDYADLVIAITGACPGLPYAAAREAAAGGAEVWGFSSSVDEAAQRHEYPDDDLGIYSKLVYVPKTFPLAGNQKACKKYRNIVSTAACDAAIIICGRWGTLNEFTNLIDFGKTIGVLAGSGGIADELPDLARKVHKDGQGRIIFERDPQKLIEKLLRTK